MFILKLTFEYILGVEILQNKVARILFITGVLTIVCGGAIGLLMIKDVSGLMFLISAVVSGIFVIGFSEIIKLLDEISQKLSK